MKTCLGLSMIVWIFLGCMQVKEKKVARPSSQPTLNSFEKTADGEIIFRVNSQTVFESGQTYQADRIVFESGTILWFASQEIHFKAKDIQFEQPVLIGFYPKDQAAGFAQYGQPGGKITFNALKMTGHVQMNLAGQNGGEGYHGGGFRIPKSAGSISELIECPPAIGASGGAGGWVMVNSLDLNSLQIQVIQTKSDPGIYGIAYLKNGFDLQKSIQENRNCRPIPYHSEKGLAGRICLKSESLIDQQCAGNF